MDSAPKPSDTEEKKDAAAPAEGETLTPEAKPVEETEKTSETTPPSTDSKPEESDQSTTEPANASGPTMQDGHAVVGPAESSETVPEESQTEAAPEAESPAPETAVSPDTSQPASEAPTVMPAPSEAATTPEVTPTTTETTSQSPVETPPDAPDQATSIDSATQAPPSSQTEQPPAPQSTFMDSMPPAHSSGGLIKWVIAGVIVLVLAGGAFLLLGRHKTPAPQQTAVVPTKAPTPTPNPTANWKTYTSDTAGYSVKYPPTWTEVTTDKTVDLEITSSKKEVIKLTRQANPQKLTVSQWMKQTYPRADLSTYKEATISGQDTMKNDTKGAAYILLPDKEILTVLYLECAQATCGAGKAEPETFDSLVASLQTSLPSSTTSPSASPSSQPKK